jgi:hypothetical protein
VTRLFEEPQMGVLAFKLHHGPSKLNRPRASDRDPSSGFADIFILALSCGTGLVASLPLLPLLTRLMADENTFGFLVGILG